jgi:NAD(P)-dependent dehydrogenase (short-subunit alcohol dehydrogenase family)
MTQSLEGIGALVTGAGSGIGNSVARALAERGAVVTLVGRRVEPLEATVAEIVAAGGRARAFAADVTDADAMDRAAREADAATPLGILITCAAGPASAGPSETLGAESWRGVIDVDLTGTFYACQAAGRAMLRRGYGRIVNLASFHVVATYPQRAAYVAAKAGVVGLTQALAVEWGGRGVTVNAVAPGPIRTPRTSWFLSQDPANEDGMIGRTPSGRLGDVADVVEPILFLASRESRHVSGQTLVIDGGWTKNAWWGRHPFGLEGHA